jgi:hypothetical protein
MPKFPQLPNPGNPAPRPGDQRSWIDLLAFLGVLALGGILIALGHTTAGSLAIICTALGGLFAVWTRSRPPDGSSGEPDDPLDEDPR